jgi:uncharacterized protein YdbL (DUF1318 family)
MNMIIQIGGDQMSEIKFKDPKDLLVEVKDAANYLRLFGTPPTHRLLVEAADEIEDLMFRLEGTIGELDNALSRERTLLSEQEDYRIGAENLEAEIERLTAERNEARRMYCRQIANESIDTEQQIAAERGWNCYEEDGK